MMSNLIKLSLLNRCNCNRTFMLKNTISISACGKVLYKFWFDETFRKIIILLFFSRKYALTSWKCQ